MGHLGGVPGRGSEEGNLEMELQGGVALLRELGLGLLDLVQQRAVVVPGVPQLGLVATDLFENAGSGPFGQGSPAARLAPLVYRQSQEDGENHGDGFEEQLRELVPEPGTEAALAFWRRHDGVYDFTTGGVAGGVEPAILRGMARTLHKLARPLLFAAVLAGCGQGEEEAPREELAPAVEAVPARRGTLPLEERLNGVVKADNQVAVMAEIEAPILEVLARNGEAVRQGQPLVRLNGDTLRDQLRQAEASVRLAQASAQQARAQVAEVEARVVRTRALAKEDLVSEMQLETEEAQFASAKAGVAQADAQVEQARATVQERRSALDKTVIRAPVAGRIGQRNAEVGMLAGPDDVLFLLGDMRDLVVEVPLTEEMLGYVRQGHPVRIGSPALKERQVSATLTRISPFLEASSFSTVGEIDVANDVQGQAGQLRPGMFVTVDVLYGQSAEATLVPSSAIWEDPRTGIHGIYVTAAPAEGSSPNEISAEPRRVQLRPVEVIAEGRAQVGVRGVQPGEWVVIVGQNLLSGKEGATARVRRTTWERVLRLQGLQREDLLEAYMDKQQRLARERGTEPPSSEEFLKSGAGKKGG